MKTLPTQTPLAAILRGLPPEHASAIGAALFNAGFRIIEVPLNRPGALEAIETLARELPAEAIVGGGTVLSTDDVDAVCRAGGQLVVSPNCDTTVIRHALRADVLSLPGVATPTEAFAAIGAGARTLKVFPAEVIGPKGLAALVSVLPANVALWPVGGIDPPTMGEWVAAGARGFGLGGSLYKPGDGADTVGARARSCVAAWRAATPTQGRAPS
jgi:2-dehydro-3-deoxyphosphogalactonate aldolase